MRVVIVGSGMVGLHIARELINEGRDVVIIEKDGEVARRVDNELDCMVINEDGTRPETLRLAKTENADWFLAMTGSDSVNIVACGLVAAESRKTRTIARVETPFYSSLSEAQKAAFGLGVLVNPAMETARAVARTLEEGFAEDVIPLHRGALQLRRVFSPSLPYLIGKKLSELEADRRAHFLVAAVVRDGGIIVPKGDTVIEETDKLYVLGTPTALDAVLGSIRGIDDRARKIIIAGASRIGERLIDTLMDGEQPGDRGISGLVSGLFRKKPDVTILEEDPDACKRLAHVHEHINIVNVDCLEEGTLEASRTRTADLFVTARPSQAENILIAQLAKFLGAKKTVALTTNHRFLKLGTRMDIDSFICSNDVVVSAVLETVRKAHIRTIHDFYEDDVEIVELRIGHASPLVGKALRDIELPREVLVAFILQGGRVIVPTGTTVLNAGDEMGLIAHKRHIPIVEHVFGGGDGN
jgi:trk system potassium uptake protein TrkA